MKTDLAKGDFSEPRHEGNTEGKCRSAERR